MFITLLGLRGVHTPARPCYDVGATVVGKELPPLSAGLPINVG